MSTNFARMTHHEIAALWPQHQQIFTSSEVDLKDNVVIDSSGIAFLVQWAKATPNKRLVVRHASPTVTALIKTFHLEPIFDLQESAT